MLLSPNFSLEELTVSNTAARKGLDNTPSPEIIEHLRHAATMMEVVRGILAHPIHINSGYRSAAVNKAVGGAKTSAHMSGYAIDFLCPEFGNPFAVASELAKHKDRLGYDQIIHEYRTWCHISFDPKRRLQDLSIFNPKQGYLTGIHP